MGNSMVWIKICGIGSIEDALTVKSAGADAIGFMFYPRSKRYIDPMAAAAISTVVQYDLVKVGVFVDEDPKIINQIVKQCQLDLVQLHGHESPAIIQKISAPVILAKRLNQDFQPEEFEEFSGFALLIDSHVDGTLGGTGKTFPWEWLPKNSRHNIIVAGGLNPQNIQSLLQTYQPWGVDVSSGVEKDGKKDSLLIHDFVRFCRQ
jgi:phosphoribosylanthranilate isomerase